MLTLRRFIVPKLTELIGVLLVVSLLVFTLTSLLPGDPAIALLGDNATPDAIAALHRTLALDQPLPVRYVVWLGQFVRGNLGNSIITGQSVATAISQRLPVTLELAILSQLLSLAVAVPLGVYAAANKNGKFDRLVTMLTFASLSIPGFTLGVLLVFFFAVRLQWFPATGFTGFFDNPIGNLRSMFLPVVTLAVGSLAAYVRVLRAEMVGVLDEGYIAVARSKGLSPAHVLWRDALKPASIPLVTIVGLQMGHLIGGTFIVETLFGLPGMGSLLINAVLQRDYVTIQACVMFIALTYALLSLCVDLAYPLIDPRIKRPAAQ